MAMAVAATAQETTPVMHLNLKSGTTIDYTLSEIESITFEEVEAKALPVAFALPTDFSSSYVQKVMAGGKQVAEVDKEYVKDLGQVVVVYPCDENGKAILTKGLTTTGAKISWSNGLPTVGEAGEAFTSLYVVDGELTASYDGETQAGSVSADLLVDRRGTETQTYRIVKIGEQYWMADNLRTTKWTDGTEIASLSETQETEWSENTTGCYLTDMQSDWVAVAGQIYNGYCAASDKIAPEGWHMPTCDDFTKIKTTVNSNDGALYRDDTPMMWSEGIVCTNETGFSAVATGTFTPAANMGLSSQFSDTYFWTSDTEYEAWTKSYNLYVFRVSSTKAVFPAKGGFSYHKYSFGHCIRLVRD